jgi:hypothetical protein
VLAQRIVDARQIRPFERVEDLLRVHGIGPKTLARMRGGLAVAAATERSGSASSQSFHGCLSLGRGVQQNREEQRW